MDGGLDWKKGLDFSFVVFWCHLGILPSLLRLDDLFLLVAYVVEAISGSRTNLDKNELIPMGRVENIDDLVYEFGCKVVSLPSAYLGLSLGALFKLVATWDCVEERFRRRLAMCKRQYIFFWLIPTFFFNPPFPNEGAHFLFQIEWISGTKH